MRCGVTYTRWTLRVCGSGVTLQVTNAAGDLLIQFSIPLASFNCNGRNTLTVDVNNLICVPPAVEVFPYCPTCNVTNKKFEGGFEVWNQCLYTGDLGEVFHSGGILGEQDPRILKVQDGIIYTPTSKIDCATGNVLWMREYQKYPHPGGGYYSGTIGFVDSLGNTYTQGSPAVKFDADGNLVTGWPAEWIGNGLGSDSSTIVGDDGTYLAVVKNGGSVYMVKISDGTVYTRDGTGNPTVVQVFPDEADWNADSPGWEDAPIGEGFGIGHEPWPLTNVATYKAGVLYLGSGSEFDIDGNRLCHPFYSPLGTGIGPITGNYVYQQMDTFIADDGSYLASPGLIDGVMYCWKVKGAVLLATCNIPDDQSIGIGRGPVSLANDGATLCYSKLTGASVGGGTAVYSWGSTTPIVGPFNWIEYPENGYFFPLLVSGTELYGWYSPQPQADASTTVPHCWPDWTTGCLTSPPPAGTTGTPPSWIVYGSAGLCTPQISVEIPSVANAGCGNCGDIGGTYILNLVGGAYVYNGSAAPCDTCSGGSHKLIIRLGENGLTITTGSMVRTHYVPPSGLPVTDCTDTIDANYYGDPEHPLQLDTGEPNVFTYHHGTEGGTQQCDWPTEIIVTGIIPEV